MNDTDLLASFGINLKQVDKILGKDTGPGIDESERKRGFPVDKWKGPAKRQSLTKRLTKREEIKQRLDLLRKSNESKETVVSKSVGLNFDRMQYLNKDQLSNPAPTAYNIQQWPFQMKTNVFPFNNGTQARKELFCVPSPGVYEVQKAEVIGTPMKITKTWGGPQTIELPTIVRCSQEPYDWCLECDVVLEGDYYYSKEFGSLCHQCFIQGQHSMLKFNRLQLETFKPARHCREYHYHDSHNNMINRGNIKDVKDMITKEAYFARFPDGLILQRRPLSHSESLKWFQKTRTQPIQLICQKPNDYEAPRTRPTRGQAGGLPEMNRVRLQFAWLEKAVKEEYVKPWLEKYHRDLSMGEEKRPEDFSIMFVDTKEIVTNRLDRYGSIAHLYRVCLDDFNLPGDFPPVNEDTDDYILCPKGRPPRPEDGESKKMRFLETFGKLSRKDLFRQALRDKRLNLRRKAKNYSRKFYYAPNEPQNDLEEILKLDKMKPAVPSLIMDLTAEREVIPILDYDIPPDYFLVRE